MTTLHATRPERRIDFVALNAAVGSVVAEAPDCCIAAAAALVAIGRRLGLDAYALAVETTIVSPKATKRWLDDPSVVFTPEVLEATDGMAYLLGSREATEIATRWNGHLVAIFRRRILLDPTIPQVYDPAHDVALTPVTAAVSEPFLRGRTPLAIHPERQHGSLLVYTARPGDHSYREGSDWTRPETYLALAGAALDRLRERERAPAKVREQARSILRDYERRRAY